MSAAIRFRIRARVLAPFLLAAAGVAPTHAGASDVALEDLTIVGQREGYAVTDASVGTRTDTPLLETPLTITVVPQQVIADQRAMGLDQVLANVAGVYSTGYEPSSENIYIRGFNTSQTLWNGFRIDEYSTTGHGIVGGVLMDNAEKVEVLSGPASILYGRVEPGGIVNVITRQPKDLFSASAGLTVGSWRQLWTGVDITGPASEDKTLLYRIGASAEHSDSWLWGDSSGQLALAPVLEWHPAPGTRVAIEGQFEKQFYIGGTQVHLWDPATNLPVDQPRPYTPLTNSAWIDLSRVMATISRKLGEDWTVTAKALHSLSNGPTSINTYLGAAYFPASGPRNLTVDLNVGVFGSMDRTDAAVFDLTGHAQALGMAHTLLASADYYRTRIEMPTIGYTCCITTNYFFGPTPLPEGAGVVVPPPTSTGAFGFYSGGLYRTASRSFGLALQDQVKLPGDLQALAGVRYQHTAFTSDGNNEFALPGTPVVPITTLPLVSNPAVVDHAFNPRVGLLWHPVSWGSLYYTYATNYGANGGGIAFGGTPLPPESARAHEVGAKAEFAGGKLVSTIALFDLTKYHVLAGDLAHPGSNFSVSIGEIQSKGAEWSLQGALARQWDIVATLSYAQPYVKVGGNGYAAGHILGGVPERQCNLWASYRFPQQALAGLRAGLGANWVASTIQPLTSFETPAYWIASAMASFDTRIGGHKASLQLNVNNLFNKDYYTNVYVYAGNQISDNYGNPTQYRLSARFEF